MLSKHFHQLAPENLLWAAENTRTLLAVVSLRRMKMKILFKAGGEKAISRTSATSISSRELGWIYELLCA
jgi:hypothetical protein